MCVCVRVCLTRGVVRWENEEAINFPWVKKFHCIFLFDIFFLFASLLCLTLLVKLEAIKKKSFKLASIKLSLSFTGSPKFILRRSFFFFFFSNNPKEFLKD